MNYFNNINHIVVLMLENRSFDCILGKLYPQTPVFNGLSGLEYNRDTTGKDYNVWNWRLPPVGVQKGTLANYMTIPNPDPGEDFPDMNMQIFGTSTPVPGSIANMSGFVEDYLNVNTGSDAFSPMHHFICEDVPALSQLARQFAVSDTWHASAPCQTWPNRFFVHTATAKGAVNNGFTRWPFDMPTVYGRLPDATDATGWKIYYHDFPQCLLLTELEGHLDHFRLYDEFRHDALAGTLPAYSFIEPRYFSSPTALPNDQHPPHNVALADQLVADVYNQLRAGPNWTETLLIITYDEHGGCYDHVPPPAAVPPSGDPLDQANFNRYGVRVPAVLVSPYIPQYKVFRPTSGIYPFDHTSIIKTVMQRFTPAAPPLTARDHAAPSLADVISLATPDNLGPASISPTAYVPSPADVAAGQRLGLNGMQQGLLAFADRLPAAPVSGDLAAAVAQQTAAVQARTVVLVSDGVTDVGTAAQAIGNRLRNLF